MIPTDTLRAALKDRIIPMPDPQPHHVADLLQRLRAWQDLDQPREALLPLSPGDVAVLIRTLHAYERMRAALITIGEWDCLNPPSSAMLADLPWLRRIVDAAIEGK